MSLSQEKGRMDLRQPVLPTQHADFYKILWVTFKRLTSQLIVDPLHQVEHHQLNKINPRLLQMSKENH